MLTESDLRLLASWAAACAARVIPVFEARVPRDLRPREAIAALRRFARGGARTATLRTHVSAALAAARETDDPAATAAARAAAVATGIAFTHAHVTAAQVRHVLGPIAYAARAKRLAKGDPRSAEHEIRWAAERVSPPLRALLGRMPAYRPSRGAFDQELGRVDALLRPRRRKSRR